MLHFSGSAYTARNDEYNKSICTKLVHLIFQVYSAKSLHAGSLADAHFQASVL